MGSIGQYLEDRISPAGRKRVEFGVFTLILLAMVAAIIWLPKIETRAENKLITTPTGTTIVTTSESDGLPRLLATTVLVGVTFELVKRLSGVIATRVGRRSFERLMGLDAKEGAQLAFVLPCFQSPLESSSNLVPAVVKAQTVSKTPKELRVLGAFEDTKCAAALIELLRSNGFVPPRVLPDIRVDSKGIATVVDTPSDAKCILAVGLASNCTSAGVLAKLEDWSNHVIKMEWFAEPNKAFKCELSYKKQNETSQDKNYSVVASYQGTVHDAAVATQDDFGLIICVSPPSADGATSKRWIVIGGLTAPGTAAIGEWFSQHWKTLFRSKFSHGGGLVKDQSFAAIIRLKKKDSEFSTTLEDSNILQIVKLNVKEPPGVQPPESPPRAGGA